MLPRKLLLSLAIAVACLDVQAAPTCQASISPTAVRLALAQTQGDQVLTDITLESFGLGADQSHTLAMLIQSQIRDNKTDASKLAASLTQTMSDLCLVFQGASPAGARLAKDEPSPERKQRPLPRRSSKDEELQKIERAVAMTDPAGLVAPSDTKPGPTSGDGGSDTDTGEEPATDPCADMKPGDLNPQCERTRISDLTTPAVRNNVVTARQAYEELVRRLRDKDPEVTPEDVERAANRLQDAERNGLLVLPNYGLFVGPAFTLDSEGGFQPRAEFYAKFDSGRLFYRNPIKALNHVIKQDTPNPDQVASGWVRGYFDASYITEDNTESEQPADSLDLFGRDNGRMRVNAGVQWHPMSQYGDWLGLQAGVGLTVPQEDGDTDRTTGKRAGRTRWFAGLHSQTTYRYGIGEVFLGLGDDRFYDIACVGELQAPSCGDFSHRYLAEGTFTLADNTGSDWSVVGKITADIPRDHEGNSDIILSVLLRRDLDGYLASFKKKD